MTTDLRSDAGYGVGTSDGGRSKRSLSTCVAFCSAIRLWRMLSRVAVVSMAVMTDSERYVLMCIHWATVIFRPTNTRMPPSA
jgi:hypothetical protein